MSTNETVALSEAEISRRRTNRLHLLGIFAAAFVPLVIAASMYYSMRGGPGWGTVNRGEFLSPALTYREIGLTPFTVAEEQSNAHWLLLLNVSACAEGCKEAMHNLQQIPTLLGRESDRVRLAWVGGEAPPAGTNLVSARFPASHEQGLLLLDPIGNVVMFYRYEQVGKPLLEDLKHLLKNTSI